MTKDQLAHEIAAEVCRTYAMTSTPGTWQMPLTKKQRAAIAFIVAYRAANEVSPTLQEIADEFGVSKVSAHERVKALTKKGYLTRVDRRSRSIELVAGAARPNADRLFWLAAQYSDTRLR